MGQPLYCSAAGSWCVGRERLWWWSHPLPVTQQYRLASMAAWLSSTAISHQSPPSHPLDPSLCSQQQHSPWDCSTTPKLQLPATAPAKEPAYPSEVCMAATRTAWFSFHLDCHRSVVSLSALNISPLTQTIDVGIDLFCWSGTAVCVPSWCSTCTCVWSCVPDVSMERDVLHVHLLLRHFALPNSLLMSLLSKKPIRKLGVISTFFLFLLHGSHPFLPLHPHHHLSPRLLSSLNGTSTDS